MYRSSWIWIANHYGLWPRKSLTIRQSQYFVPCLACSTSFLMPRSGRSRDLD